MNDPDPITIKEVNSPALAKAFLQVHVRCNQGDPHFVRPLDRDIRDVFDPASNKAFRHGEVIRWVLFDERERPVGRIAAFVNRKYKNKGDQVPVGGIGFFDCPNDYRYAEKLFDTARDWLRERGMEAMDGPINFGERDRWWGLLVEGFTEPMYGMNYNPPYYQGLFERYGFQVFYHQICWYLPMAGTERQLQPKFYTTHDELARDPTLEARYIRRHEVDKFAHDFCAVYNQAWAQHEGNKTMEERTARKIFQSIQPIMDPYLIWFVYHEGEPIAMWINIPDINQIVKKLNGKLHWWNKLRFAYYRWRGVVDRFAGIVFGVIPEFQGKGVDYYMIVEGEKTIKTKTRYRELELEWQGDFNPKILNISRSLGATEKRRMATYRYLFDRDMPFARHPMLA
ncbi:MAG: hypothetical protein KDC54_11795 [Lewinella sp.]|nr:hypothetical protein [Lewinella sp.]